MPTVNTRSDNVHVNTTAAHRAFRFRPGTIDEWVYHQVVGTNEYRLPRQFRPDDVIIDIGAHIGSFSYACWLRGSRNLSLYEPAPDNCEAILYNLHGLPGITLHTTAVWRSDTENVGKVKYLTHTGFPTTSLGINTGGGNVIWDNGEHMQVPAESFADVLDRHIGTHTQESPGFIRLLKIDAETSEFPILLTAPADKLAYVAEIVGEYHEIGGDYNNATIPAPAAVYDTVNETFYTAYTVALLEEFLRDHGFQVTSNRLGNTNMGHFRARKPVLLAEMARRPA
jgi:FkbM family methyltransferase